MSKRVLFIEHDHASEAGPISHRFAEHGYEINRFLIVDEANYLTPNVTVEWPNLFEFDVLVIMGAPWGAWEDERIGNWLIPEMKLVLQAHNAGIPILGICFGGQLMARVLGGTVARAPQAELGWYEINSDDTSLIETGPWFQYHWDRWQLPPGGTEIARTSIASQAFTYGRTLGLQFHPEIDPRVLDLWLAMEGGCVEVESEGVVVEELRAQTARLEPETNKRGYELVDRFLSKVASSEVKTFN
jgi:GMP synthase-like glutamine amidotransferase